MCDLSPGLVLGGSQPGSAPGQLTCPLGHKAEAHGRSWGMACVRVGGRFSMLLLISMCSTGFSQKSEGTHFTGGVSGDCFNKQPCQLTGLPFPRQHSLTSCLLQPRAGR